MKTYFVLSFRPKGHHNFIETYITDNYFVADRLFNEEGLELGEFRMYARLEDEGTTIREGLIKKRIIKYL